MPRSSQPILWAFLFSTVFLTAVPTQASAAECRDLAALEIPGVQVLSSEAVSAGELTLQGRGGPQTVADLPAFCRVAAVLKPAPGSNIGIELWLPSAAQWNGKYLALGNGAFAGSIGTNALVEPVRRGYAASSTDTGHTGGGGEFALDADPLIDFAYRAVHEMAAASKRIMREFYDEAPRYSFFNGCSTGGRQALAAVQRFPADFDGVVAGAPANYTTHLQGQQIWMSRIGRTGDGAPIPQEKLSIIHEAVVNACDVRDGVPDRVIESPLACAFDPQTLACGESGTEACLTGPEIRTLESLYRGPSDSSGASLFPGSALGSENGWGQMIGPEPMGLARDVYRYMVFRDESWNVETFDAARDVSLAERAIGPIMDSVDPDLGPFTARGGKLLLYHGWSDPGITPYSTVAYYEDVLQTMGPGISDSVRLFMVPGMGHCRGGEGPDTFDALGIIDDWVETGEAPDRIVASRVRRGQVDRTRPLCPYPQVARYDGTGSTDDAANFSCAAP